MAKEKPYADMDIDELENVQRRLSAQRDTIREEARTVQAWIDKRIQEQNARRIASNLSDEQRAALLQVLKPDGIDSSETFGGSQNGGNREYERTTGTHYPSRVTRKRY